MNHGSLFSGIGGFDLAAEWMGWKNVFSCEIESFPNQILSYYWPHATHFRDICTTDFRPFRGQIDILTGGFPCQPFSNAGKRKGTEDTRFLWPEMLRAIREIAPSFVVGENVPGLLSQGGGWYSEMCALTWKTKGTKSKFLIFRLQASVLATKGKDFGLLLTPTATQRLEHPTKMRDRAKKNGYKNGTQYNGLASQLMYGLLPSPAARDYKGANSTEHLAKNRGHHDQLPNAIKMLPTPTASQGGGNYNTAAVQERGHGKNLKGIIQNQMLPTPTATIRGDCEAERMRRAPSLVSAVPMNTGMKLQPAFVAWMMHFPEDWTRLPFLGDGVPKA
jgi:hypothetical protein